MANWIGLAVATLVMLLLTPYLVRVLGNERYGVYEMAKQVLAYVSIMALGAPGAVTRFASREIAAGNVVGLNRTLSAAMLFYMLVGGVGIAACGLFGLAAPTFFGVTASYAAETRILFLIVGCNFFLILLSLTYGGVLMGYQRYDLLNVGNMLRDVGRAGLIVLLFTLGWATLGGLSAALLGAYIVGVVFLRYAAGRLQPGLRISLRAVRADTALELMGFGLWNTLVQIGNVIMFATPAFIVAKLLGPDQVVFYAVPAMMANRLLVVVSGMANTLAPMAATTLVTGDREHFRRLLIDGTRAAAALCFPLGATLLVFSKPFLHLWLGPTYEWAWVVYAILMIGMFGRIAQTPTMRVLLGGGSIRGLAFIQIGSASAVLVLTIALASWTSWGVQAVALGVAVPLFVGHTILLPMYAVRQIGVSVWQYWRRSYLGPILSTIPGVGVGILLSWVWPPTGWLQLIVEVAVSLVVIAVPAWYTCLDAAIRRRVLQTLGVR